MKKLFSILSVIFFLYFCSSSAMAASVNFDVSKDIQVEITSPKIIHSAPIHNDTIEITVTNNSQIIYKNLSCYLTIVDVGRNQTYPVDEFGEEAYQTRKIILLAPGQQIIIPIPVRIMYVGEFRFIASVIDYDNNQIFSGSALNVTMAATSKLNKNLVLIVAACVPVILAIIAFLLIRKRKKIKA